MLGYRSYVGQEVEVRKMEFFHCTLGFSLRVGSRIALQAGTSSTLPYILTSILPTSGSSGGPLVDAETGAVVGMISGRRMDNRVEGERGWGSAAEQIYEVRAGVGGRTRAAVDTACTAQMFALPGFTPASAKKRI